MKLSARNSLKGTIVEVKKGQTTAHIRIDIGGTVVTASITNEAVDDLKLQKGQHHQGLRRHGCHRLNLRTRRNVAQRPPP
jgi:molybdopterin-binding protein